MTNFNYKKIYDISPLISADTAVFPGDTTFELKETFKRDKDNDYLLVKKFSGTTHLGAHTDATCHYASAGKGIDQVDLEIYLGVCLVVSVKKNKNERITTQDIAHITNIPKRILFKTDSFNNYNEWNDQFNSLSPDLVDNLADKGVKLIGIDTPSVDPANDENLLAHKKIYSRDINILEGIYLEQVPEGNYFLSALPLKIKDGDASPVRAVLLR